MLCPVEGFNSFLMGHEIYCVWWVLADDGPQDNSCSFSSSLFRLGPHIQEKQLSELPLLTKSGLCAFVWWKFRVSWWRNDWRQSVTVLTSVLVRRNSDICKNCMWCLQGLGKVKALIITICCSLITVSNISICVSVLLLFFFFFFFLSLFYAYLFLYTCFARKKLIHQKQL